MLVRHGETEWAKSGQHTGVTDIPLTERGREQAKALREPLKHWNFARIFCSPLKRATETAKLAGLGDALETRIEIRPELSEFNYGEYEGLTSKQICETVKDWTVWTHNCPGGETCELVEARVSKLIEEINATNGDVAVVAHGHVLRIFTAVYLRLTPEHGKHFMLDPCSLCILTTEHAIPAIKLWNASIETLLKH